MTGAGDAGLVRGLAAVRQHYPDLWRMWCGKRISVAPDDGDSAGVLIGAETAFNADRLQRDYSGCFRKAFGKPCRFVIRQIGDQSRVWIPGSVIDDLPDYGEEHKAEIVHGPTRDLRSVNDLAFRISPAPEPAIERPAEPTAAPDSQPEPNPAPEPAKSDSVFSMVPVALLRCGADLPDRSVQLLALMAGVHARCIPRNGPDGNAEESCLYERLAEYPAAVSARKLAGVLGCDVRTVKRTRSALAAAGLIVRDPDGFTINLDGFDNPDWRTRLPLTAATLTLPPHLWRTWAVLRSRLPAGADAVRVGRERLAGDLGISEGKLSVRLAALKRTGLVSVKRTQRGANTYAVRPF